MIFINFLLPLIIIITLLYLLNFIINHLLGMGSSFETLSAYECGFEPLSQNARMKYSIVYWLIGILYLIFDLELIILMPLAIHFQFLTFEGLLSFYLFFLILILGYIYEWKTGSLDLT